MYIIRKLFLLFVFTLLCHCKGSPPENTIVIGTIAGPETELVKIAAENAQQHFGLNVKIVEFNDYNLPNEALNDGSLDANMYQHLPYLNTAIKARHYQLVPFGKTFLYPMGLYSKRFNSLKDLPDGATIALPNDPSNEARALFLLQQANFIQLASVDSPDIKDITNNAHQFKFKLLDAAQLPRILPDVDAAIINTTFAIPAGLKPTKDAILLENTDSPYVNIMVIQQNSSKIEQLKQFMESFHSDEVKVEAQKLFGDAAVPAW